jgi:hypothetical protein
MLERAILVKDHIIEYFELFPPKKKGKDSEKTYKYSDDALKDSE